MPSRQLTSARVLLSNTSPQDYDYAMDIWSAGAVLAEAVLRTPDYIFSGGDYYAVLEAQAQVGERSTQWRL